MTSQPSSSSRSSRPSPTRRQFIKRTAGGAVTMAAAGPWSSARGQVRGANERIGIGFIGCGGRSGGHQKMLMYLRDHQQVNLHFAAVCDPYRPRMERARQRVGAEKAYMDYRDLLADRNVDVVCIATPDFWHAQQAIDAIQAGKHIYCEKPLSHWSQFDITRKLYQVWQKSDVVFQLGTQAMSDGAWHQMKQLVRQGLIGRPIHGETGFFRVGDFGERGMPIDDPNARPGKDLDWDLWLGDRPKVPHNVDRQFRWRLFMDYAGGPATDLYPHSLTQVIDIMGVGLPDRVVGTGGIHRYFDCKLREVPDSFDLIAHYDKEKATVVCMGTQANDHQTTQPRGTGERQPVIRGWDGTLTILNNREILFTPVRVKGAKPPQRIPIERRESNLEHWKNLFECARQGNKQTWSPMDLAFRTQTILQMAMLAWRESKVARFDASQCRIVL